MRYCSKGLAMGGNDREGNGNETSLNLGAGMGMRMNSREREGVGLKDIPVYLYNTAGPQCTNINTRER